jgi:hypothetical protein
MTNFSSIAMAAGMVCGFLLVIAGAKLALDRQTRARGGLMIVAGLVIIMNVMIWTV